VNHHHAASVATLSFVIIIKLQVKGQLSSMSCTNIVPIIPTELKPPKLIHLHYTALYRSATMPPFMHLSEKYAPEFLILVLF
jgi:hypothetical protein